ncbi:MAG TPA: YgiQ family radical SAM protein, partial [bacterium]|nr:YgiQ family radical SAM protein [bacterium]
MFIPTTRDEMARRRWDALDIVLVTGDAYIDSPYNGAAIIGHHLIAHGFRVGIIAQPATDGPPDITRLGEPLLFWGVTAGSVDSMVSNHTALGKRRREDDLTAGGVNDRRPDRASIVYAGLIRRYFKHTVPIVLGGIEASLRRVAHYDLWSDTIRRGLLFDAKADILVYGMAERAVVELATALRDGWEWRDIRGLCYIADAPVEQFLGLPPYEKAAENDKTFTDMFLAFYRNSDPLTARGMHQRHGDKWLIHNPPQP